jgi:DNA-binding transcriptional LysR family regulator
MDTALLRCFLTLRDTKSFSVAAQRLNVTQSTVSHQLGRLEDLLGVELFSRTTRSCTLTREGSELVPIASNIMRLVEEMNETFKPELIGSRVVLCVPDDHYLIPNITDALERFMASRPSATVEVRAGLAVDHVRALRDGLVDLAVLREVGPAPADSLRMERLVWVAGEKWTRPADGVVPLAVVGGGGGCIYRRTALEALERSAMKSKCLFSCTSLEGVISVVRAGLAITVLPEGENRSGILEIEGNDWLPELPACSLSLRLADKEPTRTTKTLAEMMTEALLQQ